MSSRAVRRLEMCSSLFSTLRRGLVSRRLVLSRMVLGLANSAMTRPRDLSRLIMPSAMGRPPPQAITQLERG